MKSYILQRCWVSGELPPVEGDWRAVGAPFPGFDVTCEAMWHYARLATAPAFFRIVIRTVNPDQSISEEILP